MAYKYLRRKRKWNSQPQELVEIDWSNPLARELAFAHIPSLGLQNLVNGRSPIQVTTTPASLEVGPSGVRYRAGSSYAEHDPNGLNSSGNSLTLMSIWAAKDGNYTSGEQFRLLSCRTGGNQGWSWGRAGAVAGGVSGNLTYQTMVFQGVAQYTEATPTIEAFVDTTVACRISGTTASWFARGTKSSSDTTVGTSSTGGNLVLFGQGPYASASAGWADREYAVLAWRRPLSDIEIATLSANPWQLFLRSPRHFFYPGIPSGANTYTFSASGSVSFTGAVSILKTRTFVPSGSIGFSGASVLARTRTLLPSGAITFSGTAPFTSSASYQFNPSGEINFSGAALMYKTKVLLPSGGVTFSGSAGLIFIPDGVVPSTDNRYITVGAGRSMRIS